MKKLITAAVLGMFLFSGHAQAAATVVPPVVPANGLGGPAFVPFVTALGLGLAVTYLNAEGVPFPLCGVNNWQCFYDYPEPVHKNGV